MEDVCNTNGGREAVLIEPYPATVEVCDYCGIFNRINFLESGDGPLAICNVCWGEINGSCQN